MTISAIIFALCPTLSALASNNQLIGTNELIIAWEDNPDSTLTENGVHLISDKPTGYSSEYRLGITYRHGGDGIIPVDGVEITHPVLSLSYYNSSLPSYSRIKWTIPLPTSADQTSLSNPFYYSSADHAIRNGIELSGDVNLYVQCSLSVEKLAYVDDDGVTWNISLDMNNANTSNELKLTVDTQPMKTQLKSTGYATHYTKWRSEWGEAPSNANECDFVMYQFNNNMYDYYHKYSSVTTLFELIPSAPGGTVVAAGYGGYNSTDKFTTILPINEKFTFSDDPHEGFPYFGPDSALDTKTYIIVAYPKPSSSTSVTYTCNLTVNSYSFYHSDRIYDTASASISTKYEPVKTDYDGDLVKCSIDVYDNEYGQWNLEHGFNANHRVDISASARLYNAGMVKHVDLLLDNFYLNGGRLTSDDYFIVVSDSYSASAMKELSPDNYKVEVTPNALMRNDLGDWVDAIKDEHADAIGVRYDVNNNNISSLTISKGYITLNIKPTEHVISLLNQGGSYQLIGCLLFDVVLDDGTHVGTRTTGSISPATLDTDLWQYDINEYGTTPYRDIDDGSGGNTSGGVFIESSSGDGVSNHPDNQSVTIRRQYSISGTQGLDGYVTSEAGLKGTIYWLLPLGATYKSLSWWVGNAGYYGEEYLKSYGCTIDITTVDNWRSSARQMVIIDYDFDTPENTQFTQDQRKISIDKIGLTYWYPWSAITTYGNQPTDDVAVMFDNIVNLEGLSPDDASASGFDDQLSALFDDLDGIENNQPDTLYCSSTPNVNVLTSYAAGSFQYVSETGERSNDITIAAGNQYTYDIIYQTAYGDDSDESSATNLIMFDCLETASKDGKEAEWQGAFSGIDVSQLETLGAKPIIYYSTQALDVTDPENRDLSDTGKWTQTPPSDLSTVKSIAVDLRKTDDGSDFTLEHGQYASIKVTMKSPIDQPNGSVTYNQHLFTTQLIGATGETSAITTAPSNITSVVIDTTHLSTITVKKLTTGNAPSDASYSFQLCDENGDPVNNVDGSISSVDATGKFSLKSDETATIVLPAGDYIVKELTDGLDGVIGTSVKVGDDAEADGTKTDVITVGDGMNTDVTFTNEYPSASLRLLKVNKLDDTPLAGAEFKVTMPDASEKTLTSGGDGLTDVIENVMPGDYTIEEAKLPDGVTDTGNRTFTVHVADDGTVTAEGANVISTDTDDATSVTTVKVSNVKNMLRITKMLDGEVSKPRAYLDYSGIEFTLTNTSTHEKYTATTIESGRATFAPLDAGTYELQETTGKVGYLVDETIYTVTVGTDGSIKVTTADDSNVNTVNKDGVSMTELRIDNVSAKPSIEIVKLVNHESLTGSDATAGTQLTYTFTITNTGNVPLTNVTLTDELLDAASSDITVDWKSGDKHLNVGETVTGTATYAITQDDVNAGEVVNDVSVTGHSNETDEDVTDDDTVTTTIESKPSISLEKSVSPSTFAAGEAKAGETEVTYTFTITNTGNVPLTDITLDDGLEGLSDVSIAWASGNRHLNVGETVTGTATYTLTQADIDTGGVVNTATVDGTSEVNPDDTVTDEDDAEVQIAKSAELSIDKQVDKETLTGDDAKAGTQLGYTFVITNTGNVTLDGIDVVDEMLEDAGVDVAIDWSTDTDDASGEDVLLPGESVTARATYAITQDDVNAGKVDNTAHATGNDPDGEPVESPDDTVTTTIESVGAISIEKAADKEKLTGDEVKVGTVLNYSFTIENTGNVTLTDVTLTDKLEGVDDAEIDWSTSSDSSTSDGTLSPGETVSGTATYAITQADIDTGTIKNIASVTGTTPDGKKTTDDDDATTVVEGSAAISLEKTSEPTTIIEDDAKAGTTITYHFAIENIGDVTLTNVSITDVLTGKGLSDITYDWSGCASGTSTMVPGEKATATATYALTQADVDTGKVTNAATVNGTKPDGGTVDDDDDVETPIASKPSIDIVKAADQTTLDNPSAGDTVTYTFTVTNTGNVTLTDVSIADELDGLSDIAYDVDGHEDGTGITLAPGTSLTATATYHLTQDDIDAGGVDNTATVNGKTPSGGDVADDDDEHVDITADASLSIVKDVDRTELTGVDAVAGAVLTYRFTIMNTGSVTVSDIDVDDDLNGISDVKLEKTTLKPGETTTGTATYTLTQSDVDSGKVVNVARANGKSPDGNGVTSNDDDAVTTIHADASIALEKTASTDMIGGDNVHAGYEITWYLTVRNTGNATVSDISVDDMLDGVSAIDYGDWSRSLAPGAERTVSATYAITQADIESGIVHNIAVAHGSNPYGDDVDSNKATKDVVIVPELSLALVKDVDKKTLSGDAARVGETLTYSFTITNTGDVQLIDINVDDYLDGISDVSIDWSTSTDDASADGTLNAGESVSATATYAIMQDDIDAGSVLNTAIAHGVSGSGDDVNSNESTVQTVIEGMPSLSIVKTVDKTYIKDAVAGETLTYSFTVTNTGNVTLHDVNITDDLDGLSDIEYDWSGCASGTSTMLPGETATATATYDVTDANIESGKVDNTATANGTDSGGDGVTSDPSTVSTTLAAPVPVAPEPKVEIPEPLKPIVEPVIEAAQQIVQTGVSNIGAVIGIGAAVIIGVAAYVFHRKSKQDCKDARDD